MKLGSGFRLWAQSRRVRTKTMAALLGMCTLWLVGMIVWPGCVTPPLPSSRKAISTHKKKDFAFLRTGRPTRSELANKVGEPDAYFPDLRVACYRINEVTRRKLWLFLGVIPIGVSKSSGELEIVLIEFDDRDRKQRFGIVTTRSPGRGAGLGPSDEWRVITTAGLHEQAVKWVAAKRNGEGGR